MSKSTAPVLPPLEYLPESARTATLQKQIEQKPVSNGGYLDTGKIDFYSEINDKNSRSIEKFKKAAKSNPFVPLGIIIKQVLLISNIKIRK